MTIVRGDFTDYLLGELQAVHVLLGDAEAPDDGGWDDDPNDPGSSYSPYVVVRPMTTTEATGPIADSNADIVLPYSFTCYGVSRGQVEFYMDKTRGLIVGLARTRVTLGDETWKIQQPRCSSIGGVSRSDNTEPSEFSQTDVISIYMSKEVA